MRKYDCSKVLDYAHERKRLCSIHKSCTYCPLDKKYCGDDKNYTESQMQECIDIVQEWSDSHQQKTYLDDFKEKFPNAHLNKSGYPCAPSTGFAIEPSSLYVYDNQWDKCSNWQRRWDVEMSQGDSHE